MEAWTDYISDTVSETANTISKYDTVSLDAHSHSSRSYLRHSTESRSQMGSYHRSMAERLSAMWESGSNVRKAVEGIHCRRWLP